MSSSPHFFSNPPDRTYPHFYAPSKSALLLLDFHSFFVSHMLDAPSAKTVLPSAVKLTTWARKNKIQVIHCLIDVNQEPFPKCKDLDRFRSIVEAMRGSDGGASGGGEVPELLGGEIDGDAQFRRTPGCVSALKSPGLDEYLKGKGIESLVLAGLSTSGCVARTALAATDAEYVVTVAEDACADPAEGMHDFFVEKVLSNRGYLATVDQLIQGFGGTWEVGK